MAGGPGIRLLLKRGSEPSPTTVPAEKPGQRRGSPRIRCPRCAWEPRRDDLWMCHCGHAWNTFDTGGVCPACHRRWEHTQCLRCHEWSRHEDWYAPKGD